MPCHFKILRTVEFHQTDAAGFVHFSNFFTYMEEAEHAFLDSLGIPVYVKERDGWRGWPRIRASCNYQSPLRFQDKFEIELQTLEIGPNSIRYGFRFLKIMDENQKKKVAEGEMTSIYARKNLSDDEIEPIPIPQDILHKIRPT